VPKVQCIGDQIANLGITEETCTDSVIEVFLDFLRAELCDKDILAWQQFRSGASRHFEYAVPLLNPLQHRLRQRVGEMECDEVKSGIFFPMGKAATLPDSYFTKARLYRTLNGAFEFAGPQ
jgi:hypothetical protein